MLFLLNHFPVAFFFVSFPLQTLSFNLIFSIYTTHTLQTNKTHSTKIKHNLHKFPTEKTTHLHPLCLPVYNMSPYGHESCMFMLYNGVEMSLFSSHTKHPTQTLNWVILFTDLHEWLIFK